MQYKRLYLPNSEHYELVCQLCSKHKVAVPVLNAVVFGAFDDNGQLIGISAIKVVHQIEPLVADEGYPRVTQILGEKSMAVISNVNNEVTALVKDEKSDYIQILKKYGFFVTDTGMTILKKEV